MKATVDAYDGTITYYVVDPKDPIIKAYRGRVPGPLHRLLDRCRTRSRRTCATRRTCSAYQTDMYRKYHMTNPTTFFTKADLWEVSADPARRVAGADATTSSTARPHDCRRTRRRPASASSRSTCSRGCPVRPRRSSSSCDRSSRCRRATARTGSCRSWSRSPIRTQYGKLESFEMPTGSNTVAGPVQVNRTIHNTAAISKEFTLLEPAGLARRAGQHPDHPDRGLAALRPADLRRLARTGSSPRSAS